MSTVPTTNTTVSSQGLRILTVSFRRPAPIRSMSLARRTVRRLNRSVRTNVAARQASVSRNAGTEKKKWKLAICVLKIDAVKNVMICDRITPSTMPSTSAATDTNTVSSTMMTATRPRPIPKTWYKPNSFLRRFMMKLLA